MHGRAIPRGFSPVFFRPEGPKQLSALGNALGIGGPGSHSPERAIQLANPNTDDRNALFFRPSLSSLHYYPPFSCFLSKIIFHYACNHLRERELP